jgi:hypothetical protein
MINQIHPVQTKTEALPSINKNLLQVRHIQSLVKERGHTQSFPANGYLWSQPNSGPFHVPVTRWIE